MATLHYCSDGSRVSQATIERRYAESRRKKYAGITSRLPCESCGQPGNDNDHTVAQARCKVIHKTELIWHPENFPWSCRTCHRQWENFKTGEWLLHGNCSERLLFLKEHDPEGFNVRVTLTQAALEERMNKEIEIVKQQQHDSNKTGDTTRISLPEKIRIDRRNIEDPF